MSGSRYFIQSGKEFVQIYEHLARELKKAGFSGTEIVKTPMGHRILVYGSRPGMIIGKGGRNIKRITQDVAELYDLESPRLEVKEIKNPELDATVCANKLINQIERGYHFRRAGYSMLRRIMRSGARGCEIIVKGKLTSQRARMEVFRDGFIAKTGEISKQFVDEAVASATMKQGVIGVHVKIMQPDADLPDEPVFYDNPFGDELEEEEEETEETEKKVESEEELETLVEEAKEEEAKEEEAPETKPDKAKEEAKEETPDVAEETEVSEIVKEAQEEEAEEAKESEEIKDEDSDLSPEPEASDDTL